MSNYLCNKFYYGDKDMLDLINKNNEQYWRDHLSAFMASGKTQKEYCKDANINYSTFKRNRYKLADKFSVNRSNNNLKQNTNKKAISTNDKSTSTNIFTAIKIEESNNKIIAHSQTIKLFLKSNNYLELPVNIDSEYLRRLFTVLGML